MPRNETILNIFVASPSDVDEERESLVSIVNELNKTWSKNLNVRLELLKWETDVHPGFGEYPQDVINKQINDEYDIFLAIFWGKFGTATMTAESGTLEEFERAFNRFKEDPKSIEIMIYFKDHPISPSKMDFTQLQKIQEFKGKLGEKGGLFWSFDSTDDFESLLRTHLSKVAQKWSMNLSATQNDKPLAHADIEKKEDSEEYLDDESDYGLLDYIEIHEDRMYDMNAALGTMAEATEKVGQQFTRRTDEMNSLHDPPGGANRQQAKKIIKFTCDDMDRYSNILNTQVSLAEKARKESFDAMSKALALQIEFFEKDRENLLDLEESLILMKKRAKETYGSMSTFRDSVKTLPPLTSQVQKSKRRVVKALDKVLDEIYSSVESTKNVLQIIENIK